MTECPKCHSANLLFLAENLRGESEEACLDCGYKVTVPLDLEPLPCPSHDRVGCGMCFGADLMGPEPLSLPSPSGLSWD